MEEEVDSSNKISSLKKLLEVKRNRSGYSEKKGQTLYLETDFWEFLECADPYEYLSNYNKFKFDDKSKELFKTMAPPDETEENCKDLKVLGKRELHSLLKYRYKYLMKKNKEKKAEQAKLKKS